MVRLIVINLIVVLIWIPRIRNILLNMMGLDIDKAAFLGLSLVLTDQIKMEKGAKISHLNLISSDSILVGRKCTIGWFNVFKGVFDIKLSMDSHIGNFNVLKNNGMNTIPKKTLFILGSFSNITSSHYVDLSADVIFGCDSVLAGRSSELWTHGFIHFNKGEDRFIKFGGIAIGDGVYIGSNCTFNPGSSIADEINIGSGSSVSGELKKKGLYVNQPLRFIDIGSKEDFLKNRDVDSNYKTGNVRLL